jgi:glycerol-3-phosphate dehydrogenase (NAD(P)+)
MNKIAVIGAGAWGTAMAYTLSKVSDNIHIWAYEKEIAEEINEVYSNSRYLYGVWLNQNIKASNNLDEVLKDAEFVIYATPSFALRDILKQSRNSINKDAIPVFLTKGFVEVHGQPELILESADKLLPETFIGNSVYLSGPSHAEEVAREVYTGLIAASLNKKNAVKVRDLTNIENLSVFVSFDPIGVQVSAALKNVVAVAFGLADAMREYDKAIGDNTFAMIISAGLNEIQKLATAMGSTHPETFTSFSSMGDLYVTCMSHHGRNRRFGRDLLQRQLFRQWTDFNDLLQKIDNIGYLPEGIFSVKYAMILKEKYNLKIPITEIVYEILNRNILP